MNYLRRSLFKCAFSRTITTSVPLGAILHKADTYDGVVKAFKWEDIVPKKYNICYSACDRHAAINPNHRAIVYIQDNDDTVITLTYGQLKDQSNKLANALLHKGNIQKGDRVGILLSQRPETAVTHMAVYRSGAVAVPLFLLFGPEALSYRLGASGAKVLVTDRVGLEKILQIRSSLPELKTIIIVNEKGEERLPLPEGCLSFNEILENSKPPSTILEDTDADDPALIIFTSGTTGDPKGALHAHRVLLGHLPGIEFPHNFFPNFGRPPQNLMFYTPADWAWIGGLIDVLLPSLHYGVPVLAHRAKKFDPLRTTEIIKKHNVTNAFMPPTALKLMRQVELPKSNHMLSIGSGGESLGTELLEWGKNTFNVTINEFYGQTEANLLVGNCSALHPIKTGSMGKAIPGRKVAIVNDDGIELPDGEMGHIACKRGDPVMFLGYFKNEKATKEKFINDWMITGDLGKKDSDGYFYFLGREDDVINSAGYRIGPSEIEDCLIKHPAIFMCAAVGSPDPIRNEVVKCFCVLNPGHQPSEGLENEIKNFVKTRLAAHEYPRKIEFVDSLPMTTTGKIQRKILKQQEYAKK